MIKSLYKLPNIFNPNFKMMCNLIISKLSISKKENFQKLFTPELVALSNVFNKYNYELRIAGGAVRDLLMDKLPSDIDFATTATPDEMKIMFEQEQIRLIKTNGEKHGTITCRINDKENFEVTTLRIDVETNGRHANVKFTKDWKLDAERRDLTINSLFLDFNGSVYDYFGGQDDLINRRIRFVGNADARIKEDYLRILRYFRFYGRIADKPNNYDEVSLSAMKANASGLEGISGERIWVEMKKIIVNCFADSIFKMMHELGISQYLGLTGELNFEELKKIHEKSWYLKPNPITLITALFTQKSQLDELHKRVKMSNAELQIANFIMKYRIQFSDVYLAMDQQKHTNLKIAEIEAENTNKINLESHISLKSDLLQSDKVVKPLSIYTDSSIKNNYDPALLDDP